MQNQKQGRQRSLPAGGSVGEVRYKQACQRCYAAGVAGAPKFGDKAAWAPRIQADTEAMSTIALHSKTAMAARGGTMASDADIRVGVDDMAAAAK